MTSASSKPLRVLFISPFSGDTGGAEKSLFSILEHLPRERIAPEALVLAPASDSVRERLQRHNIPLHEARFRTWFNIRSQKKGHLRLFRLLDNLRVAWRLARTLPPYDLIYSNSTYSPIGAMIAMFRRSPHIWHIHENLLQESDFYLDWYPYWSMKWAESVTNLFICVSKATKKNWEKWISSNKLHYIRQGILTDENFGVPRSEPLHKDQIVLCVVGQVAPRKNQREAIEAVSFLHQKGLTARLLLAGSTVQEYQAQLVELANALGIGNWIQFLGYVHPSQIRNIYDQSDIHITPFNSNESAPLAILESMASGCPTISSNFNGAEEFIVEGLTGLTYSFGNPSELANAIVMLHSNHSLYAHLSQHSIAYARSHFMLRRIVGDIIALIEYVASGKQPPPASHPDETRA